MEETRDLLTRFIVDCISSTVMDPIIPWDSSIRVGGVPWTSTRRDSKKIVEISQSLGLDDTLPEFRRGSNSEALNRGVDEATIDRNNRWRKIEKAGARKANLRMRDHYAEVLVSLKSFLKYAQAL